VILHAFKPKTLVRGEAPLPHPLSISPIPKSDNYLRICYNIEVLTNVLYKRITEKANYQKEEKVSLETF
jgi:hypothetical protein